MMSSKREELKKKWTESNQGHVFKFLDRLSTEETEIFWQQLESIDVDQVNSLFQKLKKESEIPSNAVADIKPIDTVKLSTTTDEQKQKWKDLGYESIVKGEVVVLLMAGGQGTRLGYDDPKGTYNVGLPSGKSLFQIQAERLIKLQELTKEKTGKDVSIPWYIMTSDGDVDQKTRDFYQRHNYFGLSKNQIFFFTQGILPAITPEGQIILESSHKFAVSPNGNGELWRALESQGIIDKWEKMGIKWVWSYCVDNILVKIGDPVFLGFCIDKNLEIGAKVVPKLYPEERVGVLALKNNRYTVLEYSEIDEEKRLARSPTGDLVYNASHLVINTYSLPFIRAACNSKLPYHIAKKRIPHVDENGKTIIPQEINGWKLELFVFDIFEYASRMLALETNRYEEFSPLKNSLDIPTDNPRTCCTHLSELHRKWLKKADGIILNEETEEYLEISPLISYEGEGLENYVLGKSFTLPFHLHC